MGWKNLNEENERHLILHEMVPNRAGVGFRKKTELAKDERNLRLWGKTNLE